VISFLFLAGGDLHFVLKYVSCLRSASLDHVSMTLWFRGHISISGKKIRGNFGSKLQQNQRTIHTCKMYVGCRYNCVYVYVNYLQIINNKTSCNFPFTLMRRSFALTSALGRKVYPSVRAQEGQVWRPHPGV